MVPDAGDTDKAMRRLRVNGGCDADASAKSSSFPCAETLIRTSHSPINSTLLLSRRFGESFDSLAYSTSPCSALFAGGQKNLRQFARPYHNLGVTRRNDNLDGY